MENFKQGIVQFGKETASGIPLPETCSLRSSQQSHRSRNKPSLSLSPSITLTDSLWLVKGQSLLAEVSPAHNYSTSRRFLICGCWHLICLQPKEWTIEMNPPDLCCIQGALCHWYLEEAARQKKVLGWKTFLVLLLHVYSFLYLINF